MLIGVDHGNKQIKTVHCEPFVSGLKQSVTRPFGQNVLRYQNTYYTLSTERIPYRKDKTEDDRFFILTLLDRKSTRLNSSHRCTSRMPSSA